MPGIPEHPSSNAQDPIAKYREESAAILAQVRMENALADQHERNEARSFNLYLKQVRPPDDPQLLQMEKDHPYLLERKEPHDGRKCPLC